MIPVGLPHVTPYDLPGAYPLAPLVFMWSPYAVICSLRIRFDK